MIHTSKVLLVDAINIESLGGLKHLGKLIDDIEKSKVFRRVIVVSNNRMYKKLDNLGKEDSYTFILVKYRLNFIGFLWQNFWLNSIANRENVDVIFSLSGTLCFSRAPRVLLIQNLLPFELPLVFRIYKFRLFFFKMVALSLVMRLAIRRSRSTIFLSRHCLERSGNRRDGAVDNKFVIPHGFSDGGGTGYDRLDSKGTENRLTVISIFSFCRYKNVIPIIKAVYQLRRDGAGFELLLIGSEGEPSYRRLVEETLELLDPRREWCSLKVGVNSESTRRYLRNSDVAVFGTECEAFGYPIAEALASRVPVLAAKTDGVESIFGDALLYFNPRSFNSLLVNLSALLESEFARCVQAQRGKIVSEQWTSKDAFVRTVEVLINAQETSHG